LLPYFANHNGVNPTAHVPGYFAAESGTKPLAFIHTLRRTISPSLIDDEPNEMRFVPTKPSWAARPAGMLNIREFAPECDAVFVTMVFSNPFDNNASFPPLGGSQ
jgi:hypothetical protein